MNAHNGSEPFSTITAIIREQQDGYREPPHNLEAEQGLLGAILVNNKAYERVSEIVRPEEFADPVHGRIFEACGRLIEDGKNATPVTLKPQFDQDNGLEDAGGWQYLIRLATSVVTVINAPDYAQAIHEAYLRRCAIDIGNELVAEAYCQDGEHTAEDCLTITQSRIDELQGISASSGELVQVRTAAEEVYERAKRVREGDADAGGLSTGISDLDRFSGLMQPSALYILGGRPAMGKSALAIAIAENVAKSSTPEEQKHVAIFSLEMAEGEIIQRYVAERTGITQEQQQQGPLDDSDLMRIGEAIADIQSLNIHIDDTPGRSLAEMRRRCKRMKRRHGLSLIVVDYLQLMRPSAGQKFENKVQEISEYSRGLKELAKEMEVPVLALSQLSRKVEEREDKRPVLADLRESGSIEQDADVVLFVYRDEHYLEKAEPKQRVDESDERFAGRCDSWEARLKDARGIMEAIVAKRRHGRTGTARLFCDLARNKITNLDKHHGGF